MWGRNRDQNRLLYIKPSHYNLCGNLNGSCTLALYQSRSRSHSHISSVCVSHRSTASCVYPFCRPHSMSKLSTLRGAMFCHSPSAGCDTSASQATSTSSWQREFFSALSRTLYFPAGSLIQLHPTM